jgi:DNA-binding transcriptional LysR family regulator
MEIERTLMFVKVVQHGSFTKAAAALRLPKSTVSKAITRLESETGTKLLLRTTRSQTLTAAGRAFYETCIGPVRVIEEAQKSLYGNDSILSGIVKLTAPTDLGIMVVAPVIGELCRNNPQLSFELHYSNHVVDLVKEGFDLALRIGKLRENNLRAKKLGQIFLALFASPSYLRSVGKVRTPQDLASLDTLAISSAAMNRRWVLRKENETAQILIRSRIESNQVTSLVQMAIAGAGIALLPIYLCQPEVERGALVRILPEWSSMGFPVSLVSPLAMSGSARIKLVSENLGTAVREALVVR